MKPTHWFGLVVMIALLASASGAIAEDKNEEVAKKAVEAFNKALNTNKLEEVMKTISVPYYHRGLREKKSSVEDEWEELLHGARNWKTVKITVKDVTTFEKLREKEWKKLPEGAEKELAKIEKLLGKDHRVLKVEFKFDDGKWEPMIGVRIADGKGIVVGTFD